MSDIASIVLRRRTAVIIAPGDSTVTPETIHAISDFENRLERLGYTLSGDALMALTSVKPARIKVIASATVEAAAVLVGQTDRNGNAAPVAPMYPNFPRQVEEASDAELFLNAFFHYFGDDIGARIMPEYQKLDRGQARRTRPLRELTHVESIDRVTNDIHASLIGQKAAWSELDREDVSFILRRANTFDQTLVFGDFGSKANLAWYAKLTEDPRVVSYASSLTDVLRIAVAVAGANPEFVKPSVGGEKLGNISRPFRRAIVARINELADTDGDFRRRLGLWKTVGKLLHIAEYKATAPKAVALFERLRKNDIPASDRGLIQSGAVKGAEADALRAKSPGEFARDLDWALRTSDDPERTLRAFSAVASLASARTLWGATSALENRDAALRIFVPKGQASKAVVAKSALPALDEDIRHSALHVLRDALAARAAKNSPVPADSKVFIAPELDDLAVPFSLRQQGLATRVVGRGSRVKLTEGENLRFFMWWKDIDSSYNGRVDLDMSLSFMDKSFQVTSEVAYYNLRNGAAAHSGDITSAPEGAAEYVDLSDEYLASQKGARYVLMSVNSYTHQHFKAIPEAIAGVMLRDNLDEGDVFDGKTVETAFSLTQDAPVAMPYLYDIKTRELIWLDYSGSRPRGGHVNAAAFHRATFSDIARAAAERTPVTVGQLVRTHVAGRDGTIVANADEADVVYDASVAYQAEKLLTEWL